MPVLIFESPCQLGYEMEKQQYPANAVKHGEILIQCLIKIPRSRDRGHGITQMLIVKYRWLTSYLPILGSLAHHCKQYHVYRLCDKQKIMVGAGCSPSGRYPSPVKVPEHASFFLKFTNISESFRRLCSIFWALAKGFKWPRGEFTREISFELGRFGTALETTGFSHRLMIARISSLFCGRIPSVPFLGRILVRASQIHLFLCWNC